MIAFRSAAALFLILLFQVRAVAITYDAAADFSHAENPNGVWSYGWEDDTGFHLFTEKLEVGPEVYFWTGGDGPLREPTTGKNEGQEPFIINDTTTYAPGDLGLHAGRYGQRATLRWTAPETGRYLVNAQFRGGDPITTADAQIHKDGILASSSITGEQPPLHFAEIILFNEGEHVDFSAGFGNNGTFWFDTVITRVRIMQVGPNTVPDNGSPILLLAMSSLSLFLNFRSQSAGRSRG